MARPTTGSERPEQQIYFPARQQGMSPDTIVLQAADWAGTVALKSGRSVTVRGPNSQQPGTVNFNHLIAVISVASNASLSFENMMLLGFASKHSVASASAPPYCVTWQGPWPSILFAPDAHYSVTNVTGQPLSDNCTAVVQHASQSSSGVEVVNNVTVLLRGGPATTPQAVYAYGTQDQVGTMLFSFRSSISICTPDALADAGAAPTPGPRVWPLIVGVTSASLELATANRMLASRGSAVSTPPGSGSQSSKLPPELWRLRWLGPLHDEQVEVGPLLGRGSFGRVYKGRWTSSLVAIKIVDHLAVNEGADKAAAEEQRVAREALLSASLSHPNVIATYKICSVRAGDSSSSSREGVEAGHRPTGPFPPPEDIERARMNALLETWLVQEFADRGSLADAIAAGRFRRRLDGSLDVVAMLKCLNDVAAGMAYLHSAHIVHGDLKIANVLLRSQTTDSRGYICKICDFGLSRILDPDKNSHVSATSHGTASWMPPEVLDKGILTRAADLYSFALIIWSLVAGEEPWKGMSLGVIYCAVCKEGARPPVPAEFPLVLLPLMQECWASDPAARPTFLHVQQRLQTALRAAIRASQMQKAVSS
ncbi:hypothetical protein WJX81_002338 [Elliptochloris bilobata]|uniref:Protein kinase domain-containing protein n=1 Tax=Elliptochloris bilobata TaxID=381761 RepID=A0AAW1QYG6_9CHLO